MHLSADAGVPEVRVFTRDRPCTKKDIWAAFRRRTGFATISTAYAHSVIGVNVPRVMEREGRIIKVTIGQADCYQLTEEGREWLLRGIESYVKNHPSEKATIQFLPHDVKEV